MENYSFLSGLKPRNAASGFFYGVLAVAQVLLDIPVLTDTFGVGRGFKGGPTVPLVCQACGLPVKFCDCIAGIDF